MEERKLLLFKKIERKKKGKRGKKAERRKGIVEIDAEKKEKLKSKRMPYQAQLKKEFHKCRLKKQEAAISSSTRKEVSLMSIKKQEDARMGK